MNIGVYVNESKDKNFVVTNNLIDLLVNKNINFAVHEKYASNKAVNRKSLKDLVDFADVMIVLGGDGTILQVIKECTPKKLPVVGINLGYLGFLMDFEKNELEKLLDTLLSGRYVTEERTLIEVTLNDKKFVALNDVVISKGENTRLINISAKVDGALVDNYFCDGIIVSTPTGSTAYSMSVGGPILAPNVEGFIINPISSHSLHSRPIVVSSDSEITLNCSKLSSDCQLVVDGELADKIKNNEIIKVNKSKNKATFIRVGANGFFDVLLNKLNKWGVTDKE